MQRAAFLALAALAGAALVPNAHAAVVDDTSLASPGVYFGTGNSGLNNGFTVDTEGNVEVGLSAITRFVGPITPIGNVYNAPLGPTAAPNTGSAWGVDFSINLQVGGGTLTLGDITATLSYTDTGTGFSGSQTGTFAGGNGIFALGGNACYTGTTVPAACAAGDAGIQNSEPGSLLFALGDINFNDTVPDIYDFTLTVSSVTGGAPLASDMIVVNTGVPEPASLASFGIGLVAIGFFAYRRRKAGSLAA